MNTRPKLPKANNEAQLIFGKRIRYLRLRAGYSQEELASLCLLDRTYIGGIERGERNPSLKNILRIAEALAVPVTALFELAQESKF